MWEGAHPHVSAPCAADRDPYRFLVCSPLPGGDQPNRALQLTDYADEMRRDGRNRSSAHAISAPPRTSQGMSFDVVGPAKTHHAWSGGCAPRLSRSSFSAKRFGLRASSEPPRLVGARIRLLGVVAATAVFVAEPIAPTSGREQIGESDDAQLSLGKAAPAALLLD